MVRYEIMDMCRMYRVATQTGMKVVRIGDGEAVLYKSDIFAALCAAIAEIEAAGNLVSGVVELCSDGSKPRVAYRNSKEYGEAKKRGVKADRCIKASFISHWDSGAEFESSCKVNLDTREVYDIEPAGHPSDDDSLWYEEIKVAQYGTEENSWVVENLDEALDLGEFCEYYQEVQDKNSFWRGQMSPTEILKMFE